MSGESRGKLIALEGIDGSGKSTQADLLARRIGASLTREPGGTPMGLKIREVVLSADLVFEPKAEALLMLADRAHHVESFIRPVLESGRHVVSDRYSASTLAYQGFGRGLDISLLELMTSWVLAGLGADLNVLIDLPVEESLKRAASRAGSDLTDRFESQGVEFLSRVAEGFRTLSRQPGSDWVVVDGRSSPEEIHRQICRELESRFPGIVEG